MSSYVLNPNIPHQRYFEDMTRIPHGSYHEQAYSDYLVRFAEDHGLRYRQYDSGSVIIYKPAASGYEDHTPVMLQAHIDMVWEKTPESTHDFEKDPLTLVIRDGQLWADGTTLGRTMAPAWPTCCPSWRMPLFLIPRWSVCSPCVRRRTWQAPSLYRQRISPPAG